MRAYRKPILISALTSLTVFASLLIATGPAQAYWENPRYMWISQNSSTCDEAAGDYPPGNFISEYKDGKCYISSTMQSEYYDYDAGGRNLFVVLYVEGVGGVAYVSFEAYDEILVVADTRNDSDTVYVWINNSGPYYPRGSDDPIDRDPFDLSLTDGQCYNIKITDDKQGYDVIAKTGSGLPCLIP